MENAMENSGVTVNAVIWTLFIIALIAVVLRVHARVRFNQPLSWDDHIMSFTLLLNLASCICTSIAITHGIGRHINVLTPEQIPPTILWATIATDLGIMADTIPKLAIAILINRIFAPSPLMRSFNVTITVFLIGLGVLLVIISFEQCQPIPHQWERENVPGSCWSPSIFAWLGIGTGVYSTSIDFFFTLYPLIIVSRLNMQLRKKIIIMIVFGLCMFILFTTLYKTAAVLPKLRYEQVDFSTVVAQVILWTVIESSVVIIAGSIPTWGWIFRTERFEKVVTWFSLHSSWRTGVLERLSSHGSGTVDDGQMLAIASKSQRKEELDESITLQSIDRIERMAYS